MRRREHAPLLAAGSADATLTLTTSLVSVGTKIYPPLYLNAAEDKALRIVLD